MTQQTILIAEDDKALVAAYVAKFTKLGFKVVVVANGEQALAALKSEVPDIMLLDLIMPHTDGFSVLEEMNKHDVTRNIPVIVASNLGQQEDIDKARSLGVTDYVVKTDLSMDDLIEKIQRKLRDPKRSH